MDHRICFVGDSMTQGTCDPEYLGWTGRVAQASRAAGNNLTAYNLGIRRNTSRDMLLRWQSECFARLREGDKRYTVFCMGTNDMTSEGGQLRIPENESVANFEEILETANQNYETLAIGPFPVGEPEQDDRIDQLNELYAQTADALRVPYLPVSHILRNSDVWQKSVAEQDGCHPGAAGYALVAEMVLGWDAWWFKK